MLKQIPLGDLEVPAPGEGVKGVADGLSVLVLRPEEPEAGLSPGFDGGVPSQRGGGSLIGGAESEVVEGGGRWLVGRRWLCGISSCLC
jgi:hypothetical protein